MPGLEAYLDGLKEDEAIGQEEKQVRRLLGWSR